ncbi:EamA family transporter RarD [Herbidospora sp. NEAU-GS84]|uniref:EamA family transporter RarD n=1 Tax=Herbidospora solisilvae TaxID=2696284 RepID=A0A7C9J2C4_9ACTN|nr:EamA family transporter RarD [Herbidospora solisilvae]NAS22622.1 EamA family transporter RarD [Herbidospora solisilvae]
MPDLRRGVWYGIAAYALWGLFPLYWPLLKPSGAVEILAHRMLWSLAAVVAILAVRRHWKWIRRMTRRQVLLLTAAAGLVSANWGVYIYAVNSGHVVESALGYFINPLVSILFGVVILGERLRRWQWVAVGLGATAVVILTLGYGQLPWIALTLAFSFGLYGLVKKKAQVGAAESLTIETLVMLVPAAIYLFTLGEGNTFGNHGTGHALLLISSGIVTAVPLLFFAASVITVPLTIVGLLQYIAPVLQFLCGVLIVKETMPAERWLGFGVVWLALAVFTWDSLRYGLVKQPVQEKELATVG